MDNIEVSDDDLKNFLIKLYLEERLNKKIVEESQQIVEKETEKLRQITPMLFFQFLSEKGVSGKCISCGSEKLSVPQVLNLKKETMVIEGEGFAVDSLRPASFAQFVSFDDVEKPSGILKTYYVMNCLNCGHLTLYRASTVLKWFERQKLKGEESDE